MPNLIVNADDLGRSAGINRGVVEAHKKGIVTSTTVMINYPDAAAGIELVQAEAPFLGIGLHLTLTSGGPVSPVEAVPSLLKDGRFPGIRDLPPIMAEWQSAELALELGNQIKRFVELAGKPPTHLDAHHHSVYFHPASFRVMLALAAEYGIPIRRPQFSETAMATADHWLLADLAPMQARQVAEELHGIWHEAEVYTTDHFIAKFFDQTAILGELLSILTNLPADGVAELMCHPGYAAELDSPYSSQREQELKWLTHPTAKEVIVAEGINLLNFAELT